MEELYQAEQDDKVTADFIEKRYGSNVNITETSGSNPEIGTTENNIQATPETTATNTILLPIHPEIYRKQSGNQKNVRNHNQRNPINPFNLRFRQRTRL